MNINELIQLRNEKQYIASEIKTVEDQILNLRARTDEASLPAAVAQQHLKAARQQLAEAIRLRDQEIQAAQAQAAAARQESESLKAQLASLLVEAIQQLLTIVAKTSRIVGPSEKLHALELQLDKLLAADIEAQLTDLPDVIRNLVNFLDKPLPEFAGRVRLLAKQIEALRLKWEAALERVSTANDHLVEYSTRTYGIPEAEAAMTSAKTWVAAAAQHVAALESALAQALDRARFLRSQLETLTQTYTQALDKLFPSLEPGMPIALLPVRLETRFTKEELLIRIYPDDIHQDTHEADLTKDDEKLGRHFWEHTWRAGSPKQGESVERGQARRRRELAAWAQLARRFGPARAAWVARTLEPTNPADRPINPVAEDGELDPEPIFPEQAKLREGAWTRAPYTRVLPDRWMAIGYVGDKPVFAKWGELIPDPLFTGLALVAEKLGPDMSDNDARWMVDFEEAEKKGMGIRIGPGDVPKDFDLEQGFAAVMVLGVKATLAPEASAQRLHELLEAHRYTGGLDLVPQGTPTNNTPEALAGYVQRDPGDEIGFTSERNTQQSPSSANSDGALAAEALGVIKLSPFVFSNVPHADLHDQQDASQMNTLIWPATGGYFLTQLMEETFIRIDKQGQKYFDWPSYLEWRGYFIEHVRARGPLPALRVANQPYGLLPVSSLAAWDGPNPAWPGTQVGVIDMLRSLRDLWRAALGDVPHLTLNDADPDNQLVKLLGMDALSTNFYARRTLGPRYTDNLWFFLLGSRLDGNWWRHHDELSKTGLTQLGLQALNPRLAQASFVGESFELKLPLIQNQPLSENEPLVDRVGNDNYIAWLAKATPKDIHDQVFFQNQPEQPKPLLYRLLRHATLQAYAEAALQKKPVQPPLIDPEFVDVIEMNQDNPPASPTNTAWRHLVSVRTSPDLKDWLPGLPHPAAGDKELAEFRNSLLALSALPSAALQRLLGESLDLCTYRLDAWLTSLATQRLKAMRQKATGIYLGGYGWVENLQPRNKTSRESTGFIHAPSLAQATTAAILRSGYLSHKDSGNGEVLAIDLSSRRVRLAQWLLDGVRNGQPLGALLGYRFERGLHENHPGLKLDQYIVPFRELVPLVAGKLIPNNQQQSVTHVAASSVVDGLALLQRYQQGKATNRWDATTIPFGQKAPNTNTIIPGAGNEYQALIAELKALEEAVDAISDTTIAESIYQVVQGNPLRSGASLDAISRGEAPPQEFEVVSTPRTGIGLTHRLLVAFSGAVDQTDPYLVNWEPIATAKEDVRQIKARQVRAAAEPHLNAWAAKLLSDPNQVFYQVEYLDPATQRPILPPRQISLRELNLCPLDILYASAVSDQTQRSDLEQWMVYHAMQTRPAAPVKIPADAGVRLIFARGETWDRGILSVPELLEVARAVRELVVGARALDARDLSQPGQPAQPEVDIAELRQRATQATTALQGALSELRRFFAINDPNDLDILKSPPLAVSEAQLENLENLLDLPPTVDLAPVDQTLATTQSIDLDALRETLLHFAYFGLAGAAPLSPAGETTAARATLLTQARGLANDVDQRLNRIGAIAANDPLGRLHEVFGRSFCVLPQFTSPVGFAEALAHREEAKDAGPEAVIPWFQHIARIRDGASRLGTALTYAEVIGAGDTVDFQVAQLPIADDRWVGLKSERMRSGRLSLVVHAPTPLQTTKPLVGLLIEEWVEVVPNPSETTALTFHYDAPGACAPQAILLAVPPNLKDPWSEETLAAVVSETFELAQLRAVDPDALAARGALGHYLPGLYFAYNQGGDPNGDTIATDFKTT